MAGATNKSAKRLGYTKGQIQAERAKGGVLSHAALMANGAPAKPTKAYKALAADMAERKKGLTRKVSDVQRSTMSMARNMLAYRKDVAKNKAEAKRIQAALDEAYSRPPKPRSSLIESTAPKKGNLDLRKQTERRYELTERLRVKTDDLRDARRSAMNSGDDARVAKLDSQIKRMTARADRADEGWTRMGTALNAAPAEKRQQWEAKADRAEKRKALVDRTVKNIAGVSKIARGMQQKAATAKAVDAKAAKAARLNRIADRYTALYKATMSKQTALSNARTKAYDRLKDAKRTKNKAEIARTRAAAEAAEAAFVKIGFRLGRIGNKMRGAKADAGRP